MKQIKFKAHFNRINMQRGNPNVWTVHTSRACYQVQEIKIFVPVTTVFKKDGPQPRAHFDGVGEVIIHKNTAYLVDGNSLQMMGDDDYFDLPRPVRLAAR